ncbi:MAG: threonine/serine dehydratase [Alphaproteobacteria bacterium]|nr:threonine/serine dehydratase [Alphaproteobacteria bacterium]
MDLPDYSDIEAAAVLLRPVSVLTPLLEAPLLNELVGGRVLVKAEVLQRTGSFKFRGAFNRVSRMTADERARGVICFSSGNHAQGVAAAAAMCGTSALIVMPTTAPRIKVERCRALGAEIILHDGDRQSMEQRTEHLAGSRGLTLVRPFDDRYVIAGQGTIGLEISAQAEALQATPAAVLVPCSGGGLTAGIGLALERRLPGTALYTVEPASFDDTARSLAAGERVANVAGGRTICDALLVPQPGEITFAINRRLVRAGLSVTDDDAMTAMLVAFEHLKIVLEPSGAAGLAALLARRFDGRNKTTIIIASGGNVDAARFQEALAHPAMPRAATAD